MTPLRLTKMLWSKSCPTVVSSPSFVYRCSFERGQNRCNKAFSRQCDLRRHLVYHTKPIKCKQCNKGFPSPKDLQRHDNSVHNNTIKYYCPYEWCRDSIKPNLDECIVWGFRRKAHWQKHMKDEHKTTRKVVKDFQRNGIPIAILKDERWIAILPNDSNTASFELTSSELQSPWKPTPTVVLQQVEEHPREVHGEHQSPLLSQRSLKDELFPHNTDAPIQAAAGEPKTKHSGMRRLDELKLEHYQMLADLES